MLGDNAAGDLDLKLMLIYYSENPRAPKNYPNSTVTVLCELNNEAWRTAHLFAVRLCECIKPIVMTCCSEKRFLSKYYCPFTIHLVTQDLLKEMYNEIHVVFMPATTTSILPKSNFDFPVLLLKKCIS